MLIVAAATAAASGVVQTFPRDGWGCAKISQRGGVWTVKAGADSLRISASPKGQFESLLVVSNTADSLVVDATAAFAKGAQTIHMYSSLIDLKPIDGQDVMVESVWAGARGSTQCSVLLEGSDKNGRHWWRAGKVSPFERPRTFRHSHFVDEGLRGLHYRLDIKQAAKAPVVFYLAKIGPYGELAPRPQSAARPELLFHAPFDGSAKAAFAKGSPAPSKEVNLEYAPGKHGEAVRLSSALKSMLAYDAAGNLNHECGTVAFWFKHEWKETKRLGCRDDNGRDYWRGILHAPAENKHPGDGSLWLWWWKNAMRADRGDLDGRYTGFWQSAINESPGIWHHYVFVWDDCGTRLYIDGKAGSTSDSHSPQRAALAVSDPLEFDRGQSVFKTFFVGSRADGNYKLDGLLDDLRIWSAPMRNTEALALYRQELDAILSPDIYYGTEGEPKTITVRVKANRNGEKPIPAGTRVRLLDAAGKSVAQSSPIEKGVCTISATLPKGEYSFALPDEFFCHKVPYWVLGRGNPVVERGAPRPPKLLCTVTPDLATLSPDKFRSVGRCRMGELGGVKYLEAGPKRGDRFALRLSFNTNSPLHCIEIDYPDDGSRTMDLIVQRSKKPHQDYTLQVGRYGGCEIPVSGKILTYRCLYWATAEDATLVAMTARPDSPAAIAAVRVYSVPSGALSATPVIGGGRHCGERRHFGSYWEDPAINYDYGANHSSAASLDALIDRKAAYMKYLGQDTLAYPGSWYHGLIAHDPGGYNPRSHSRHFLQAWFEKFDREGLRIVPTVNQQTIPIEEGVVTRASMSDGTLHPTTIAIWDTGKPSWGGWHGKPPNFCILHPDVQAEFLRVFDALIADGAGHSSFSGVCLHLTSITCPWWGGIESGYNDYCIDAFTRATGVKVPADRSAPLRAKAYAAWLKANAYEKWVQWRCDVLTDFYVKLAKRLSAARPDLRLWVNAGPTMNPSDPDYAQDGYRERKMREAGIDAAQLVRRIPNLVMGMSMLPCAYRFAGWNLPEAVREKYRAFPDTPSYFSVFGPASFNWLNLHDAYWENPIGAGKTGELLSCDWLTETNWRVSALQANGRNAMKCYAAPFLFNDIQGISCGGFLEGSYGMEDMLSRFAQSFRALPAVKFPTIAASGKIILRGGEAEGRSWFYIVNADDKPARVALHVPANTHDLATRALVGAKDGSRTVALDLGPYDFRSFAAPSGAPALDMAHRSAKSAEP